MVVSFFGDTICRDKGALKTLFQLSLDCNTIFGKGELAFLPFFGRIALRNGRAGSHSICPFFVSRCGGAPSLRKGDWPGGSWLQASARRKKPPLRKRRRKAALLGGGAWAPFRLRPAGLGRASRRWRPILRLPPRKNWRAVSLSPSPVNARDVGLFKVGLVGAGSVFWVCFRCYRCTFVGLVMCDT